MIRKRSPSCVCRFALARARLVSGESAPGAHLMQTFSQSDLSDKFCNSNILHSHHNSITLIRGLLTFCQVAPSLLKPKWKGSKRFNSYVIKRSIGLELNGIVFTAGRVCYIFFHSSKLHAFNV